MLKTTIHTFNDLNKWLSDNFYFDSGHVLAIRESLPIGMAIGIAIGSKMDKKAFKEGRQLDIEIKY